MNGKQAQPFLKGAGGKTQLLQQMATFFPDSLAQGGIQKYVEPFIGSGAVFFKIANTYPVQEFI